MFAQTPQPDGKDKITAFIVERKWEGITPGRPENKLGIKVTAQPHPTRRRRHRVLHRDNTSTPTPTHTLTPTLSLTLVHAWTYSLLVRCLVNRAHGPRREGGWVDYCSRE